MKPGPRNIRIFLQCTTCRSSVSSSNDSVSSTQAVVVVRVEAPRMSDSDEILGSLVRALDAVGGAVDGGQ